MATRFAPMKVEMQTRVYVAFVITPLVTPMALAAALAAYLWLQPVSPVTVSELLAGATHISFFFAFFGLPLAYGIELLVGLPMYRWTQHNPKVRWRRRTILILATAAGAIAFPLIWAGLFGLRTAYDVATMLAVGSVVGAAAGVVFAICAFPLTIWPRPSNER